MGALLKRMRHLKELLDIRLGPGALILPGDVKRIHMRFANRINNGHMGPRKFWRMYLPRLKYHNPAVPMTIDRHDDNASPALLTVTFADATQTPADASTLAKPVAATGSTSPNSPSSKHVPADLSRTTTIDMTHKRDDEIFNEFQALVSGEQVEATEEERELLSSLAEQRVQSERDRVRQAEVLRKRRREKEVLDQARRSVEISST